jgi:hypothetical protein
MAAISVTLTLDEIVEALIQYVLKELQESHPTLEVDDIVFKDGIGDELDLDEAEVRFL